MDLVFNVKSIEYILLMDTLANIFCRKDSIYGAVDLNVSTQAKSKASSQKNALYLCQYCLVHLGDLARYRHQAKQAETYYR